MITRVYDSLGADENMPIDSKIITNSVESAQKKVEGRNFSIRKNVLKYDDVMNAQREIIYKQRRQVLDGENLSECISNMFDSVAVMCVSMYYGSEGDINTEALKTEIRNIFGQDIYDSMLHFIDENANNKDSIIEELTNQAHSYYEQKEQEIGSEELRELERVVLLKIVDQKWMDHIDNMEELKNGIGLRAYGQKDPVIQYRIEGFEMFDEMIENIKFDVVKPLMSIHKQDEVKREEAARITGAALQALNSLDKGTKINQTPDKSNVSQTVVNDGPTVGRNDSCPCGSGKKYKNCCGK